MSYATVRLNLIFIELCIRRAVTKDPILSAKMLTELNEIDAELDRREGGGSDVQVAGSH